LQVLHDLVQIVDDHILLLYRLSAYAQEGLQLIALLLPLADLVGQALIVLFEAFEKLNDLRVLDPLVSYLLLQLLVLFSQHLHVVFEKIDVLPHSRHLLLVLLDPLAVLNPVSLELLLQGVNQISTASHGRLKERVRPRVQGVVLGGELALGGGAPGR
jgi:hypothetical protein